MLWWVWFTCDKLVHNINSIMGSCFNIIIIKTELLSEAVMSDTCHKETSDFRLDLAS